MTAASAAISSRPIKNTTRLVLSLPLTVRPRANPLAARVRKRMHNLYWLQARDFTNFGYPCWDGIKDTFRIL